MHVFAHAHTHTHTHTHRFDYAVINEAVWAWRRLTDLFVVTMCRGEAETLGINDRGGRREETKLERGRNNKRAGRTEKKKNILTPAALQPQTLKSGIHLTSLFPWPPTSLFHPSPIFTLPFLCGISLLYIPPSTVAFPEFCRPTSTYRVNRGGSESWIRNMTGKASAFMQQLWGLSRTN